MGVSPQTLIFLVRIFLMELRWESLYENPHELFMTTAFPINQIHEICEYQLPVYWICKPASHMMVGHFPADVSTSLEYNSWKISNEIHGDLSSKYDYIWWSDMMIRYDDRIWLLWNMMIEYDYEEHIKQIWWSTTGFFLRQNWRREFSAMSRTNCRPGPSEWGDKHPAHLAYQGREGHVWNISYVLVNQIIH